MDAAKRREARRRKLLESSEDRFKRIERLKMRSHEAEDPPCDSGNAPPSAGVSDDHPKSHDLSDSTLERPPLHTSSEHQRILREKPRSGEDSSEPPRATRLEPEHPQVHCCNPKSNQESENSTEPAGLSILRDVSQASGYVDSTPTSLSRPTHENERLQQSTETPGQCKDAPAGMQSVVSLQTLLFIMLALITRIWLVRIFPGQSIIVLFLATEVLLFFIGLEQAPIQTGPVRIITALLTFRGVSPHNIQLVQRFLGHCQGTLKDFSTFLFVFVMVHGVVKWLTFPATDQFETVING